MTYVKKIDVQSSKWFGMPKGSFLTAIIGDFNAKSCNWYSPDKTTFEGSNIENITSQNLYIYFKILPRVLTEYYITARGRSGTAATSKMERFLIIVNGWKPLTIITKRSIFHVEAVLDPSLTAKYCSRIRGSPIPSSKLSSSNCIY